MRTSILIFSFLFISLLSKAQDDVYTQGQDVAHTKKASPRKNWKSGYVVTINGDTIRGLIKDKPSPDLTDRHVMSFEDQTGLEMKYVADSLRQYTILGNTRKDDKTFVSIKLSDAERENTFLRLYADGPCKVYGLFEIITGPSTYKVVEYKYIRVGDGLITAPFRVGFKRDMKKIFSMCPAIIAKLDSKQYTFDNWLQMATDYNNGICK